MSEAVMLNVAGQGSIMCPSVEYLNKRLKTIEEAIYNHETNIDTAHTKDSPTIVTKGGALNNLQVKEIDINKSTKVQATDVIQDSQHRMITDNQIESFKSKVNSQELNNALESLKDTLNQSFNKMYANLLNFPNAVDKINALVEFIKGNSALSNLISLTVLEDLIKNHEDNVAKHITTNDRKALNILLNNIEDGLFDKLLMIGKEANHASEADNAKKIDGYNYGELINNHLEAIFISRKLLPGIDDTKLDADIVLNNNIDLKETFEKDIHLLEHDDICAFKPGKYHISKLSLNRSNLRSQLIIRGSGHSTEFFIDEFICGNILVQDCSFQPYNEKELTISNKGNDIRFENIKFTNANIICKEVFRLVFKNCIFDNCSFTLGNTSGLVRIEDNYFKNCMIPKFNSQNTIIKDNFRI